MKRATALCLLTVLLILSLFSCGKKTGDSPATAAKTTAQTDEPETVETVCAEPETTAATDAEASETTGANRTEPPQTDGWETVKTALAETDNRSFLVALDASETDGTGKRDPRLFAGPDAVDEGTPAVERAVYSRNRAACERLGVTVGYVYWNDPAGEQANRIKTQVASGDASAPDLFVSPLCDLWRAAPEGCFADIYASDGWLDFTTDGWFTDYTASLSLTRDRAYVLAGDAFSDLYRGAVVLPFNLTIANAEADRLLPCVNPGETLAAGETFSTRFFDFIQAGKWTYGTLAALSEAIFRDMGDAESRDDFGDLLGIACDAASPVAAYAFLTSSRKNPLAESTDGESGRLRLTYRSDGGTLGELFDAVSRLFDGAGTLATAGGAENAAGEYGISDLRGKFAAGTLLFAGTVPLGSLCFGEYATMTDRFSVAPLPKLNESDDYVTPVLPDADAGAINRNTAAFSAVTAFLQYCAENSRAVRDGYLSSFMQPGGVENAAALALICGAISSGRNAMIDAAVSGDGAPAWSALLASDEFRTTAADFETEYAASAATKQERLTALLDRWYACPKAAP